MAKKENQISRRSFLKVARHLLWIPVIIAIGRAIKTNSTAKTIKIPLPQNEGISFHQGAIIVKEGKDIRVLSSKCTHLGCSIKKNEGEALVCGCHGSRYSKRGEVLTGPAVDPLASLSYQIKGAQLWITTD